MQIFNEWAAAWSIPQAAINDLQERMGGELKPAANAALSEGGVQDRVRLRAATLGWDLWRNNNGVAMNEAGVPVRFGLANDSAKINARIKSADLIGIRPIQITQAMVGSTIGQFASLEVKHTKWVYKNTDREQAQARWAAIVNSAGGYARFITSEDQI